MAGVGKHVIEVREWVRQCRRSDYGSQYSIYLMSKAEAEGIKKDLMAHGVDPNDIRIRKAKPSEV